MLMITLQNYCNVISCEQSTVAHTRGYKFIFIRSHHMKEVEKRNQTSQRSSGRHPPPAGRSVAGWSRRQICRAGKEKATLEAEIARLRELIAKNWVKKHRSWWRCRFSAQLPKEQADMGKLKKSVRGLVVVHPMTALGREMGLQEMTGFSKTAF